ncbi:MAG TPA: DUF364 domain-containing protein [Gammaproteobacteria bacterium]|nr:DUF364 domain-containing protein [Gammaproteobacteria bacterium]
MALNDEYQRIGTLLARRLGGPAIGGLYLPAPVADETFRDEFGFVFLDDGSVGPFYVSLGELLRQLWQRHPHPADYCGDVASLLQGFAHGDPAGRALAVGTYNALSASLYRRAGFEPPERDRKAGLGDTAPGDLIGMVGYFSPLVERLIASGCNVLVLEKSPQRVTPHAAVSATADPRDLRACRQVLCTASTLINDTLDGLLDTLAGNTPVTLIGPSGSGLPDPLFACGVTAVGGVGFASREQLVAQLAQAVPWGSAGRKYQLDAVDYPGLNALLDRLPNGRADTDQT